MPVHGDPRDADLLRASGQELRRLMGKAKALGARLVHFPEGATCFPHKAIMSSTGPDTIGDAPMFAAGACGHAATNNYWISFSVPSAHSVGAPSGIIAPNGTWAARCPADGSSAVCAFDLTVDRADFSRRWREMARSGLYADRLVADDRSTF